MTWETIENAPFSDDPFSRQEHKAAEWELLKKQLPFGSILTGKIYSRTYFGIFYDAGVGFPARMNVTAFGIIKEGGMVFPDDYPALGSEMKGQFNGFDEHHRQLVVIKLDD